MPTPSLEPWPNLRWQEIENQIFVDPSRYPPVDEEPDEDGALDTIIGEDGGDEETEVGLSEVIINKSGKVQDDKADMTAEKRVATDASNLEESNISRFLDVVDDHDTYRTSVERLRDFFGDVSLAQLDADSNGIVESLRCQTVLDDRNFTSGLYRDHSRPLTPRQVYEALKVKRFPQAMSPRVDRFPIKSQAKSEAFNIERRTIFAANPDKWLAFALINTASPSQAPVLFDFIDKYLDYKPSIGVDMKKRSRSRMNLFVHLPFSTLRHNQASDHRRLASGKYLRRSVQIPRLNYPGASTTSADSIGWIHETQISMHISIIDPSCWTAYMFEDTFYKKGKEAERFAESLQDTRDRFDALARTVGSGPFDTSSTSDPIEYFLTFFDVQIERAYIAWANVVDELEKTVKR
ncbi:hypothetical protein VPNG_07108 [Cytospora leucostoma]|uniref:Uncharacterized protein n=1 Tax=Cytospora leucostoma TaxID=1230097 RepID=A0A423WVI0_9PEZI|nr:hypothetical protein VPNG_07108 [Cytospora leucostoma]